MRAELLVLGWGNRSRGDDALGPLCVDMLRTKIPQEWLRHVEMLEDHQLQIEHVLDLVGRKGVLLIDAARDVAGAFHVMQPTPQRDQSFSSHALTPAALMQVCLDQYGQVPAVTVLGISGHSFDLGDGLSVQAETHLRAASAWVQEWCRASVSSV